MLDEPQQSTVIRSLRDGNRDAWTTLYDAYAADVWRYVARLLGNRATEVADVVQETFLAAARGARNFDPQRGSLWNWLAGTAHRQTAQHWRKANQRTRLQELAATETDALRRWLDTDKDPGQEVRHLEVVDLVRYVLAQVPADYAQLLIAKYLDERSLEEIALESQSSVEATKSKLARARHEFRRRLEDLKLDPQEMMCE